MTEPIYQPRKPAETHHGKPCYKCGGTIRYKNRKCVACSKEYHKSPKRKAYTKWYKTTSKGKAVQKRYESLTGKTYCRWYKTTPNGKISQQVSYQKNRAKRFAAEGSYTVHEWIDLKERYDNRCLRCHKHQFELDRVLEQDHIVPITKGGTNWITNIQPLCHDCNGMGGKGTQIIDYRTK